VHSLRQDTDESNYVAQDSERELSYEEIKSDLVLCNGARFYNDHAHPEYCTPECRTVGDLVVQDRAGERILMACARHLSLQRGTGVRLYKNNTDFCGHSYGCHENYLLPRSLSWDHLARGAQAFLVTRQIYAGAGKFALEAEDKFLFPKFQISQRSDFFSELQSVDTMQRRPIINTRDEPHANPDRFRRFHVIIGDANMSPFATRLKVGVTALVLEAITRDPKRAWPELATPLEALINISHDTNYEWNVALAGQKASSALEVQYHYLDAVKGLCEIDNPDAATLVQDWETVLDDLDKDYQLCRDRLDWVAKLCLLREFQAAQNIADDDPWLQSLDLEYHRLDLAEGLYFHLEQGGAMRGVPSEDEVSRAIHEPPPDTRALIRGKCIRKFEDRVVAAQWDHVVLKGNRGPVKISLLDLFAPEDILRVSRAIDAARSPDDLRTLAGVSS
ncbi:MAG TPA: proteasome accessory factor PafA2 family protein, partial [Verrucomicrobiae bacterium]|nr:proteasome accessory factor PafA2 family protein [Verrucomicrobiae bacterium]